MKTTSKTSKAKRRGAGSLRELVRAAKGLVEKLDSLPDDPLYMAVWQSAYLHGIDYSKGPKYVAELERLKKALGLLRK